MAPHNDSDEDDYDRKPAAKILPAKNKELTPTNIAKKHSGNAEGKNDDRPRTSVRGHNPPSKSVSAKYHDSQNYEGKTLNGLGTNRTDNREFGTFEYINNQAPMSSFETGKPFNLQNSITSNLIAQAGNRDVKVKLNDIDAKGEMDFLISRKIVDIVPESKKNWHKIILFHLFLGTQSDYTEERLQKLAEKCMAGKSDISTISELLEKERREVGSKSKMYPVETNLPLNLCNILKLEKQKESMQIEAPRRATFTALTLNELEKSTQNWYMNTIKARASTSNPKPAGFFTLKFNEGSISAISKWSCRNRRASQQFSSSGPARQHNLSRRISKQPTVDARFRKCSICQLWGHYEVECTKLQYEDVLHFGNKIKLWKGIEHGSQALMQRPNTDLPPALSPTSKNGEGQKGLKKSIEFSVKIEMCKGYMIEQRKTAEKALACKEFDDELVQDQVKEAEVEPEEPSPNCLLIDGFQIQAAASSEGLKDPASFGRKKKKAEREPQLPKKKPRPPVATPTEFIEGDVVAWFPEINRHTLDAKDVFTGMVVKVPRFEENEFSPKEVCVEFLTCIPAFPEIGPNRSVSKTRKLPKKFVPAVGTFVWVSTDALHLVEDDSKAVHPEELRGKKRKYTRHAEGTKNKSRSMTYSERFRESGRLHSADMSLAPKTPARRLPDGTYQKPQGRRPVGLEWDYFRGLWVVPK